MMALRDLLGIELPIVQAPMAGVQASALAIAVSNAGGLGSLPCALLSTDGVAQEIGKIRAQTSRPFNVNYFCHTQPPIDSKRESEWRDELAPYYREFGIDPSSIKPGPGRAPFDAAAADVLGHVKP
ncbi:MAG TPA: nitronate monooxygenase, partial [Casimicrobiaceae bacterium]|nr:nitronate monooxygenase [Casimicrobiaceae bacterium]